MADAIDDKKAVEATGADAAYDVLEKDFQEVLVELQRDKSLERFRTEYEKLFKAVRKSHDNEKRLTKKVKELNGEIVGNAAKVQTALRLSEEDQTTIITLKKEVEKAWKLVDASHEKEARAKDMISQLKLEMNNLTRLVEAGAGLSIGEEATMNELLKQKEDLTKERDAQVDQIVSLRSEALQLNETLRLAQLDKTEGEAQLQILKDKIAAKNLEGEREARKKERLEGEVKQLKSALEARQADIKTKSAAAQQSEEQVKRLEQMLRESQGATDRLQKEFNLLNEKVQKLHHDLEDQIHTNTQLLAENSQKAVELKQKEEEILQVKAEAAKVAKVREAAIAKLKSLEKQKAEVEKTRDDIKGEVSYLEHEIDSLKRTVDGERKKADDLIRERDLLNKLKTQAEHATHKQIDLIKINENTKRNLEQEMNGYKIEAQKQAKHIWALEGEREAQGQEATEAAQRHAQALEQVKLRDMAAADLQKKIVEGETRLKQQQNLYEAVRADRNLYSKNLIQAQDEIQEMKRKFQIMNHQIDQLKEEISGKDLALVKEHFDHMKVEKEREALRFEMNKAAAQMKEADAAIAAQKAELDKLNQIITEADQEQLRQKKEYDIVIGERDILGTQLIRRNDELALLYEKIKIQQSTLNKGQLQYRDRLNELRLLKLKLGESRRELHILKNSVANIDILKHEVHCLGRELLQERTKVKALSEELENPLNVHRWRKLEGSDPSAYEMIQKVQTLQKRLISKTEEVVEADLLIQEKEKLYVELKNILARQPGPEVAEQLSIYQANLREKTKQMKAMASELNMYQAQVNEYKYQIERLTRDLNDMKRKYLEQRRREQLAMERERSLKPQNLIAAVGGATSLDGMPKFVGGGFSLSTTAS
ncbi:hypothetical protein ABBQ32_004147 [Trebouxia sp. C0010 RCD-2024]